MDERSLVAAIDACDKALAREIRDHRLGMSELYQTRVVWQVVRQNWAEVKADCAKALAYNCRNGTIYLSRARAHDATGDTEQCLSDLAACRILMRDSRTADCSPERERIDKFWQRVLLQRARFEATQIMSQRGPLFPSKLQINTYMSAFIADPLQTGNFDRSLRGFPRAYWAFREERFEDVIPACTEEIESAEDWAQHKAEARLMRGTFHLLCGSSAECQQDFDALIGDPQVDATLRAYALIRSAALRFQLCRGHEAMDAFEQAERLVRDNPDVHHQRGLILRKLQQLETALMDFEMAARLAPGHVGPVALKHFTEYHLAARLNSPPRMETALRKLGEMSAAYPNTIDGPVMKGRLMTERKDFVGALACFEEAIELAPKNSMLMTHWAVMELRRHNNAELIMPILYEAIELDPRYHMPYGVLATLELKRNNPDKAVELLRQSCLHCGTYNEVLHACCLRNAIVARTAAKRSLANDLGLDLGIDLDIDLAMVRHDQPPTV
ncbi:mitochondrial import receptor subunit TOM70-like [Drosophila obscura]|uniref:mitochondrial import receptor subunit TOM70-like n=1 Tax=Drosophila obscura TaxID=7282 RepID=UPI001BB22FD1|nr:mitochondrial import receptor subunit TOM70-like [Drosophila obscura]